MSLSVAGSIASESLATISSQISTVSKNISGANTSGYTTKIPQLVTGFDGAAEVSGVTRATDTALLKKLLQATAQQASASALSNGLTQIQNAVTAGATSALNTSTDASPAAAISALGAALQAFSASPANVTAANSVVSAAQTVAQSLNAATTATQQVREQADQGIATSVADINAILTQFQQVNTAIVQGTATGADVTNQLDQRDNLLTQLSGQIGVTTVLRPNNDMVLYTDSGVTLFETTPRSVSFQVSGLMAAGVTGNAVYVDGVPVTGPNAPLATQSGAIAGLAQLRDVAAPQFESQLDEIARGLVNTFAESDQTGGAAPTLPGLFTFAGATGLPSSASVTTGLAGAIEVNANADPSRGGNPMLLRDGGISSPGNAVYVYNSSGATNYATRIQQLITGLSASQNFVASAGLGSSMSVTGYAQASIGWLAAQQQQNDNTTSFQNAVLTQTQQAYSGETGVNIDAQMTKMLALENSYQASAKMMTTIQDLYKTLFTVLGL